MLFVHFKETFCMNIFLFLKMKLSVEFQKCQYGINLMTLKPLQTFLHNITVDILKVTHPVGFLINYNWYTKLQTSNMYNIFSASKYLFLYIEVLAQNFRHVTLVNIFFKADKHLVLLTMFLHLYPQIFKKYLSQENVHVFNLSSPCFVRVSWLWHSSLRRLMLS